MKFSKRTRYGLQFLLHLGFQWPRYVPVADVCVKENLPQKFLEAVASDLRKAGIVKVKRGAGGGYCLSRNLKEISFFDVTEVLESDHDSVTNQSQKLSNNEEAVDLLVNEVYASMKSVLRDVSLDRLLALHQKDNLMLYYI